MATTSASFTGVSVCRGGWQRPRRKDISSWAQRRVVKDVCAWSLSACDNYAEITGLGGWNVRGLGELEAVIMDMMWSRDDSATVRQIFEDLAASRPIAYTTILTVMDNLHRKAFLEREMDGRAWRYRPSASREQHTAQLMRDALEQAGDQRTALAHFVAGMSQEESDALRMLLRRRPGKGPRR
jgi:predicted transcriptional regulator